MEKHAASCAINTSRDGYDAVCTCPDDLGDQGKDRPPYDFRREAQIVCEAIGSNVGRMTVTCALREAYAAGAATLEQEQARLQAENTDLRESVEQWVWRYHELEQWRAQTSRLHLAAVAEQARLQEENALLRRSLEMLTKQMADEQEDGKHWRQGWLALSSTVQQVEQEMRNALAHFGQPIYDWDAVAAKVVEKCADTLATALKEPQ